MVRGKPGSDENAAITRIRYFLSDGGKGYPSTSPQKPEASAIWSPLQRCLMMIS